jgi:hypothetical protein
MANRYPLIVDSSSQQIKEFPSGDTLVIDNLQVTGTTTTLETTTLNVEDKNITINYSTGDSSSTADGSGLTFQDAVDASNDATILWNATNDEFDFSHPINVTGKITGTGISQFADVNIPDNNAIRFGNSQDLQIYHDGSNSYIDDVTGSGTGDLYIKGSDAVRILTPSLVVNNAANNENMITAAEDGAATLYHNGSAKIATTSTGVTVTGALLEDTNRVATNGRAIAFSLIFG